MLEGPGILSTSIIKQILRITVEAKLQSTSRVYANNPCKKIGKCLFLGNECYTTVEVSLSFCLTLSSIRYCFAQNYIK